MNVARVCAYTKAIGVRCGSPALREHHFCYFHNRWHEEGTILDAERARRRRRDLALPPLGNANAIQLSIMKVMHQLVTRDIDHKTASLLLSGLRTAYLSLRHLPANPETTQSHVS